MADDKPLEQARQAFQKGDYPAALKHFSSADQNDPIAAGVGQGRILLMLGQYGQAEQTCRNLLDAFPRDERIRSCLAESLTRTGRSEEAVGVLTPVAEQPVPSIRILVQFGELLHFRGQTARAREVFEQALALYDKGLLYSGADVAQAALAARALQRYQDANTLFREAVRIDPDNHETHVRWGDLFLEKYNTAEAQRSYETVLNRNGNHVPALVGMAHAVGHQAAAKFLDAALMVNPRSVSALVARAGLLVDDDRWDAAQTILQQALSINPESFEALTLSGAIAYLRDDSAAFERIENQVLTLSPKNGTFYARIAEITGRAYRFEKAVKMAQKAVTLDPDHWYGHTILGMNLLRLGKEEVGRSHLETGFEGDPFNAWTLNMLRVLDVLDGYQTRTTGHFVVRMHPTDADVLWPYLEPLLADAWDTLTAKYAFEPPQPILIEIFKDQQDFSVRTSGLPDIGHLLGVCFGSVITLASPAAYQPPGSINWQEVVWHEFAHVITLHMTDNKIPRWLSEGVSVFEEDNGRPEWGRRQDIELVTAVQEDRMIALESLDEAFSNARSLADLNFAYYQSSLVVEYIVEQYGFDALKALIYKYGGHADTSTYIEDVFQMPLQRFEDQFTAWIERRIKTINVYVPLKNSLDPGALARNQTPGGTDTRLNSLRRRIDAHPRDFKAHFELGMVYYRAKEFQPALKHLRIARDLLPGYSASPNPRQILADIYVQLGNTQAMLKELEALAAVQQHAFDACVKLGQAALARKDYKQAVYFLERAIAVNPYDIEVHRSLAAVSMQQADYSRAIREYGVLLALDETDPALANTNMAEALLRHGNKPRAKQYALAALEIAPMFERAQDILLVSLEP